MVVFKNVTKESLEKLAAVGFAVLPAKNEYEVARLQGKTTTLILFKSRKLLVQGKPNIMEIEVEVIRRLGVGVEVKPAAFKKEKGVVIGSDEVLKGDTFGGIVVVAVRANDSQREQLLALNVADSKTLSDEEIVALAPQIENVADFEVRNLYPEEYNEFKGNVTALLNQLHGECYSYLKPGMHVVDKYPGCTIGDVCETHADSTYVEVAAASIIARAHGLKQFRTLSERAGFELPKGSTHVEVALARLKEHHIHLNEFVKLNFRNVRKAFGL